MNSTCMLFGSTHAWMRQIDILLFSPSFITMAHCLVIIISNESSGILMSSHAPDRSSCPLYPATPPSPLFVPLFPHPTLSVCLMPFPFRHGPGQPLRSGEVLRSQIPCEKAQFPPVQKQLSGLPSGDQVYVSVSLPECVEWRPCGMWSGTVLIWLKVKGVLLCFLGFSLVSVLYRFLCMQLVCKG